MNTPENQSVPKDPAVDNSGTGYLVVRVSTALGAIPLEGALVNIRSSAEDRSLPRGSLIAALRTNSDGLTARFALPAPPNSLAEFPGNAAPYAVYDLDVSLDGYSTQYFQSLPVFDTITSRQSVDMIPLPEGERPELGQSPPSRLFIEYQNPLL